MNPDERLSRRRALATTGIAATALLAGCSEAGPGDEGNASDGGTGGDGGDAGGANEGSDDPEDPENEDNPEEDQQNLDPEAWEGVDEIVLDAETDGWVGVEPEAVRDETNPALLLEEGGTYEITFENVDGEPHNLVLWTDEHEIVEDYETELVDQEGDTRSLSFEALPEIGEYACEPHTDTMRGPVEFVGGGEGGETGNESG